MQDHSSPTVDDDFIDVCPDEFDWVAGLLNQPRAIPLPDDFDIAAPDDVEATVIQSETRARVRAAIRVFVRTLTPRQRFVVLCVFWRDMSQAEVARILRTSRAAVTQLLNRVYEKGRAMLQEVVGTM
ncbi:MAG: RNA polymerase sigma factor [Acidobacteriota bacterium]